ncbi:carotenoid ester lipase-like protein precursor [Mollisia scopiformis]|uniref:Carboxylic ester hydrolase n=1 Tax=Mollisia scopiformis TaxID=149040 RepID=A0A194XHF6_MOLSC|nr:carotenoid ester lipase-like protein precursor [Mollisia scopiformis]KUJ19202.1 carotenoid ester lipase-like protein precursor [Mollisia scopiformis]
MFVDSGDTEDQFACGIALHNAWRLNRESCLSQSAPTAKVLNGSYSGVYSDVYDQDFFLGIPFAQPPAGDLRFRQAQSLNTSFSETRNATAYSPECIGYGSDDWVLGNDVSEDCLTLNVIRPSGAANLPVGVWIYGGGNTEGGNSDPRYNLSFIVQQSVYARSQFIGVSINYRVQAWGFLFGQEVMDAGSANMGVRDQRLALQWIQENIAAFGGDPTKVTIWGESAGASGVGMQLIAYGGRDDKLFRGAIAESGGPTGSSKYLSPAQWQPYYDKITNATNCSSVADSLDCLRKLPTDVLSNVLNSSVTTGASWGPQIDGDFLQESGTTQVLTGKFVKVPFLTGRNHDEGTSFATKGINTTDEFLADVMSAGPDNATGLTIAALYPDIPSIGIPGTLAGRPPPSQASLGAQWKRASSYTGDLRQHAPRRLVTQSWAAHNITAYSYLFNVFTNGFDATIGVTHFTEVSFVFNNIYGNGYNNSVASDPFENKPETYMQVAKMMSRMWASFIVDLNPNNAGYGCIEWPKYTLDDPRNIVFDANVTGLAYIDPDIYRAEGIAYIQSHLNTTYGR